MGENIILKERPKIEFQLHDHGFELIDGQTGPNTGFYTYDDLRSIDLNSVWFPKLAKWLRTITWILNGAPLFPDPESYKKANLIIHCRKTKLGIWLTDPHMADQAKRVKELLDKKTKHNNGV